MLKKIIVLIGIVCSSHSYTMHTAGAIIQLPPMQVSFPVVLTALKGSTAFIGFSAGAFIFARNLNRAIDKWPRPSEQEIAEQARMGMSPSKVWPWPEISGCLMGAGICTGSLAALYYLK